MAEVGVREAAARLGVSPQRVHQLIDQGALEARSIGGRYVLDTNALGALAPNRSPGRPMSPRTAWALISLVETGDATDVSAAERSRLRRRLRAEPSVEEVARWCRKRAETRGFLGHRSIVEQMLSWPTAIPTGASARGHDLIDLRSAELYLDSDEVDRVARELHLKPTNRSDANIIVHVPASSAWPFEGSEAGPVTIALDLFDSGDVRSRRAAVSLWQREFAKRRFEKLRR